MLVLNCIYSTSVGSSCCVRVRVTGYLAAALTGAVSTGTHPPVSVTCLLVRASHLASARNALWEVPVAQLALVALLSVEVVPADAAACVGVALLGLRAHHVTATCLGEGPIPQSINVFYQNCG